MTLRTTGHIFAAGLMSLVAMAAWGEEPAPVPVGAGSYAASPPGSLPAKVRQFAAERKVLVSPDEKRPIPTNSWWTYQLHHAFGGNLWAYPLTITAVDTGVKVAYPTEWRGQDMRPDFPIKLTGDGFHPASTTVRDWSDWSLVLGQEDAEKKLQVTLGHGLPMLWAEVSGFTPQLQFDDAPNFFDDAGQPVTLPLTTDHLGVEYHGRNYGVFAPAGTAFSFEGKNLTLAGSGGKRYVVLAALPGKADLAAYRRYAYNVPRSTRVAWKYQPEQGRLDVTYTVKAENLKGEANRQVLQGFLPHHYKRTLAAPEFGSQTYSVVNGQLKMAAGESFAFSYRFGGVLPHLPPPAAEAIPNPYQPQRLQQMVADYAAKHTKYGADTYWGGKDLVNFAKYALIAQQLGDKPTADTLKQRSREALADWLTYTPGEKEHYFARYERWGALVGFKGSYGSEEFTDNHFHYGYFTHAGALQAMNDPEFLPQFGPMLTLVAKQYANWDREDLRFPFLRTFDIWNGHSFAGGSGSPNGNNQESTSEAMQSWAGLFFLGSALGDDAMRDAAAFGYLTESRATMQYWFDVDREIIPPTFKHSMVGILWSGGMAYGTFFSGSPHHIHGIQWLPYAPYLHYLGENKAYAKADYDLVLREMKTDDEAKYGDDWANVALCYAQLFDPDYVARKLDGYWDANSPIQHKPDTGGLTYFYTHAHRTLGELLWDRTLSIPTSAAYFNARTNAYHYVIYNPKPTPQRCRVVKEGKTLGELTVPARTLVVEKRDW